MYEKGHNVPQNYKTVVKWFTFAAKQGNADTQSNLGSMYGLGKGVPLNVKTSVKWYKLAAKQGDAHAQFNLGFSYEKGKGVSQNYKTAVKWYELAAEQGQAPPGLISAQEEVERLQKILAQLGKGESGTASEVRQHRGKMNDSWVDRMMNKLRYKYKDKTGAADATVGDIMVGALNEVAERLEFIAKFGNLTGIQIIALFPEKAEKLLRIFYETYLMVSKCHELSSKYISISELNPSKREMRKRKKLFKRKMDADKVWSFAVKVFEQRLFLYGTTCNSWQKIAVIFSKNAHFWCNQQNKILMSYWDTPTAIKGIRKKSF